MFVYKEQLKKRNLVLESDNRLLLAKIDRLEKDKDLLLKEINNLKFELLRYENKINKMEQLQLYL